MRKIFISYRRGDSRDVAQRVFERLAKQFGRLVFCDVDGIALGDNYRESLLKEAAECHVMVVVIGTQWVGDNPDGSRRIDDPNDWVHREVAIAIDRKIAVIPALIHPARLPTESELPSPLKELAFRESITVYADKQFESSVRTLTDALVTIHERQANRRELLAMNARRAYRAVRHPMAMAAIIVVGIAVAFGTWYFRAVLEGNTRRVDPTIANTWEQADQMKLQKEIEAMKARLPAPVLSRSTETETVASLGTPDYANFDILNDERFWDLRGWKDLSLPSNAGQQSFVIMTRTARILKAGEAQEIRFESRTDGAEVFLTCQSPPERAREVLQSQTGFVGARLTKVRHLVVDISEIPVNNEFIVQTHSTYVDSLQDSEDRWIGAIGYPRSDRIRLVVLMPPQSPLMGFKLQIAPSTRDKPEVYVGPRRLIESADKLSLMWEVPNPSAGSVYSIVLDW